MMIAFALAIIADYPRALKQIRIIAYQSTCIADCTKIFGWIKTVGTKGAKGTGDTTIPCSQMSLRAIFQQKYAVLLTKFLPLPHVADLAIQVYQQDRLGLRRQASRNALHA